VPITGDIETACGAPRHDGIEKIHRGKGVRGKPAYGTSRDEHLSILQQRGFGALTGKADVADRAPGTNGRIIDFGAGNGGL
jgi:hypothetical protein